MAILPWALLMGSLSPKPLQTERLRREKFKQKNKNEIDKEK
jgi:hypothetical protein